MDLIFHTINAAMIEVLFTQEVRVAIKTNEMDCHILPQQVRSCHFTLGQNAICFIIILFCVVSM